jgi:hypothetical protein
LAVEKAANSGKKRRDSNGRSGHDDPSYSFIEHLARSVLFSRYSDGIQVAMFTAYSAYFDASGHPNQQNVLTVAGFVSSVKKWSRFDKEWNAILASEGVKTFHMTDFVSNQGEFAVGWKGQTKRRKRFVEQLAACLKSNVNKSFRTTLILSDYSEINKRFRVEEDLGKPYTLCCMMCVYTLLRWAKRKKAEKHLLYYFEDGDKDKGDFEVMHKRIYKVRPKFLDKSEAAAFQPADFAGWKIRTLTQASIRNDHTLEKGIKLLQSMEMLRTIPKDAGVVNQETLVNYCRLYKVGRR